MACKTNHEALYKAFLVAAVLLIGSNVLWIPIIPSAWSANDAPAPLLEKGQAVDWWFVFKLNAQKFPGCGADSGKRACIFGGQVRTGQSFGQQFIYASSQSGTLKKGRGCVGATTTDPVGATFDQVYNGSYNYVIWNDQFYRDPAIGICGKSDSCGGTWGHSKGMLAWNDDGDGVVMQVTTPSWPASGSKKLVRKSGNTLGCIKTNNVKFSQHFFALKLAKPDTLKVLNALVNASVVTDPNNLQLVRNGGPAEIRHLVGGLGTKSVSTKYTQDRLTSGVVLISKPSLLKVPPWQLVSALLDDDATRAATWWTNPKIYTTTKSTKIKCWDPTLNAPGPVAIALTGQWEGTEIGLISGSNHAKIGVGSSGTNHYSIFGDLNQQGALSPPDCSRSQNARGGLFYVINDKAVFDQISNLIEGDTAPTKAPK